MVLADLRHEEVNWTENGNCTLTREVGVLVEWVCECSKWRQQRAKTGVWMSMAGGGNFALA